MRKIRGGVLLSAALAAVVVSGCAAKPDGYDLVKKARQGFEKLDSAKVVMDDPETGDLLMEFEFLINERDEMVFLYKGYTDGGEDLAYSDGAQFFYKPAGDEKWSLIGPGDENYIYNIYNREYRYPYASGNMFFLDGTSVQSAEINETLDGARTVLYVYDAEKLNSNAAGYIEDVESFTALTVEYRINSDGVLYEFMETGGIVDSSGGEVAVNMRISVSDINAVSEIKAPDIKTE